MNKYNPDSTVTVKKEGHETHIPRIDAAAGLSPSESNPNVLRSIDRTVYERVHKSGTIVKAAFPGYKCQCGKQFHGKPSVAARKFENHIQKCKEIKK